MLHAIFLFLLMVSAAHAQTAGTWAQNAELTSAALNAEFATKQDVIGSGNAATVRTNLGLGGAAVLSVGTSAGTVAAGNDSRLAAFAGSAAGLVPTSAGGTANYLRADGAWATPPSGSGSTSPGGSSAQVQYNNSGAFGGLTNAQLTALVNGFTSSLAGAVPASGGGTNNFLRADGSWAAPPGSSYTLPTATSSTLGGVKIDGSSIVINGSGVISAPGGGGSYTLPTANTTTLGGVKIDGSTINISGSGVISASAGGQASSIVTASASLTQTTGLVIANCSAACTLSLPGSGSDPAVPLVIKRYGAGAVTVSGTIDGASGTILMSSPAVKEAVSLAWSTAATSWVEE